MSAESSPGRLTLLLSLAALLLSGSGAAYYLLQAKTAPAVHALPVGRQASRRRSRASSRARRLSRMRLRTMPTRPLRAMRASHG
jgi:hypothetical protein